MHHRRCLLVCLLFLGTLAGADLGWARGGEGGKELAPRDRLAKEVELLDQALDNLARDNGGERPAATAPELREFAAQFFPREYARFHELADTDREAAEDFAAELLPPLLETKALQHERPERFRREMELKRLEEQTSDLAERCQKTEPAARPPLRQQLRELLKKAFALKQELHQLDLAELQQHLQDEQQRYQRREEKKDEIVDRRLQQLLNEQEELEW